MQSSKIKILLLLVFLSASLFIALSYGAPNYDIWIQLRLPRVILGVLVGLALSVSGCAFQALLRNVLADPFILGVSGGAALGSVLAIGLQFPFYGVSLTAFISALLSMFIIYSLAQVKGRLNPHTLLLVGVLFNSTTFAIILFVNALVTLEDLHRIWFLMVGSLEVIEVHKLILLSVLVSAGFFIIYYDSSSLDLLTLGDESASILGVNVNKVRVRVFFGASLMVGAVVSVSGLIGFVGLAIPHMMRLWLGPRHKILLLGSAIFGASFLVLCDLLAKEAFSSENFQTQLPVGVVTALMGAPVFFYLLKRGRQ